MAAGGRGSRPPSRSGRGGGGSSGRGGLAKGASGARPLKGKGGGKPFAKGGGKSFGKGGGNAPGGAGNRRRDRDDDRQPGFHSGDADGIEMVVDVTDDDRRPMPFNRGGRGGRDDRAGGNRRSRDDAPVGEHASDDRGGSDRGGPRRGPGSGPVGYVTRGGRPDGPPSAAGRRPPFPRRDDGDDDDGNDTPREPRFRDTGPRPPRALVTGGGPRFGGPRGGPGPAGPREGDRRPPFRDQDRDRDGDDRRPPSEAVMATTAARRPAETVTTPAARPAAAHPLLADQIVATKATSAASPAGAPAPPATSSTDGTPSSKRSGPAARSAA
ncbi:MAG: hypothetical protein U0893_10240 [Chloroflexota bacterium]